MSSDSVAGPSPSIFVMNDPSQHAPAPRHMFGWRYCFREIRLARAPLPARIYWRAKRRHKVFCDERIESLARHTFKCRTDQQIAKVAVDRTSNSSQIPGLVFDH